MKNVILNVPDKCVGCNRCVRVCPIDEANVVCQENGKIIVKVDPEKCIACGACLSACHHGARQYQDDTDRFFTDLSKGLPISMIVAPAAKTNDPQWSHILALLRKLGVRHIYDVSAGADICTWAHIRCLQKNGPRPLISQPCPAIVNYILMHQNALLKHLSPIHSPMLCTALYLRKYKNIRTRIAALSPCVAKTHEFETTGLVDYNVTIDHFYKYVAAHHLKIPAETGRFDDCETGLGSLYPMPGGLKESVEHYLGKAYRIDTSEGQQTVYRTLDEYARQPAAKLPIILDALNCPQGCNHGTGCSSRLTAFDINTSMDHVRQAVIHDDASCNLDRLFAQFDQTLKWEDFIRTYMKRPVRPIQISPAQLEAAFVKLGKFDEAARNFNCGACGCDTCGEMAQKIAKNINIPLNCTAKTHQDIVQEHTRFLDFQAANLKNFATIQNDSAQIKALTETIASDVKHITTAISANNSMIKEIEDIASQVKIIALNASIEAVRAGSNGKAFGVVAEKIKILAQASNISAAQTRKSSLQANAAIASVNKSVVQISDSVNTSYENISDILQSTKQMLKKNNGNLK